MNKFIGDAEPIDNIVYDDNNSGLYRFRRKSDGKQFVLAYSDKQCKTADVDFRNGYCRAYRFIRKQNR